MERFNYRARPLTMVVVVCSRRSRKWRVVERSADDAASHRERYSGQGEARRELRKRKKLPMRRRKGWKQFRGRNDEARRSEIKVRPFSNSKVLFSD